MDIEIMQVIERARDQHDACTGAAVANAMKLSRSYVFTRLSILKAKGLVTWTAMPGSLRVVAAPATNAAEVTTPPVDVWPVIESDPVLEPSHVPTEPAAPTTVKWHDPTNNLGPTEGVARKRGRPSHKSSDSPVKNLSSDGTSSGT